MICGIKMPDNMQENQPFPRPIITPTTKAVEGHDEDISKEEILARGLVSAGEYEQMEAYAFRLFERGTQMAASRGLILADTKYEFGSLNGQMYLIDEVHTPDSSRYFYAEGFEDRLEKGLPQHQLSKEFVREWLMSNGFQGQSGQQVPEMTDQILENISERYVELYEQITGMPFKKAFDTDLAARIEHNLNAFLQAKHTS
jgi:phosphoribosylaminoimidazole-succinocarboxamide synthase